MAENVPPPAASADATRGVPYYEKLKRDLRETLQKKRLLDKNMATLEDQIYRYEASYLEETGAGNIIKGFDNYIKGSTATGTTSGNAGGGTRALANIFGTDAKLSCAYAYIWKPESTVECKGK
ncbi:chromatin modification-related protein EAF6, partial [Lecanoromycetidae sp. Uapishka_2]